MSRSAAKRRFSRADLEAQTAGVECRKDSGVVDEIPAAYKDIDQVMDNQRDLVEVVHTVKQVLCVKGGMMGRKNPPSILPQGRSFAIELCTATGRELAQNYVS